MEQVKAEPVRWQRRLKHPLLSAPAGSIPLWQECSTREATGHFERVPGYEYRPLYATPQPAAVDGLVRAAKAILHQFSHAGADGWYSDAIHKDDVDALDAALAQIERKPEDGN